jgi:hypothetical protein
VQTWEEGSIDSINYVSTVPFEYRAGLPIIEVEINGVNALFLFDTGAPNVVSTELAAKLGMTTTKFGKINDSGGNSSKEGEKVHIDSLTIGGIKFRHTNALVMDLKSSFVFDCIGFDGIIGANLMRLAKWKIDYQNQSISLSNEVTNFSIPNHTDKISFSTKATYTPVVDLRIGEKVIRNVTFDSGSNGGISIANSHFSYFWEQDHDLKLAISKGATNYGVYGKSKNDSTIYALTHKLSLGDVSLDSSIVEFKRHSNIIGTKLFRNYDVILDWDSHSIWLLENSEYDRATLLDYGFHIDIRDNKFYVGSVYSDKTMKASGIQVGDQILKANDVDFSRLSKTEACNFVRKQKKIADAQSVVFVFDQKGTERTVRLEKRELLKKRK